MTPQAYASSLALRPESAETRRRFDALPALARTDGRCPPVGTYADERALCAALVAWDPEIDAPEGLECVRVERAIRAEGTGPELAAFRVTDGSWDTVFLVARTPAGLLPLVVPGNAWHRSCSWGGIEVSSARWSGEATRRRSRSWCTSRASTTVPHRRTTSASRRPTPTAPTPPRAMASTRRAPT